MSSICIIQLVEDGLNYNNNRILKLPIYPAANGLRVMYAQAFLYALNCSVFKSELTIHIIHNFHHILKTNVYYVFQ